LSIKRILEQQERASYEQYLEDDQEAETTTIGDLFADDLKK
jgi:small subunit ribosomal protein S1